MFNSPLHQPNYPPQFSGHETFPMRYGWLKKAFDAVAESQQSPQEHSVFHDASAIARFGVGKNMVAAMRHWATQCGVIKNGGKGNQAATTSLGEKIFSDDGLDPYMENPSTLWLLHWNLASNHKLTTWYWVFSHFPNTSFDRENIVLALEKVGNERNWSRMSLATIKRDVECFVRTYAAKPASKKQTHEDTMESPLTELSLIKAIGKKDGFRLIRGPKATLGDGVFTYAVLQFWQNYSGANTISLEALAHQPGSPGKVFQLNEEELTDRLSRIESSSDGSLRWSETAGLKQLVKSKEHSEQEILEIINRDYQETAGEKAA
ncbi:DUF4007 family protein [Hydrocarboniclastica marina]|uniref:DUF4007 family protein n=1 Tax=Hydrocarboniclastica marina TaxID=2259620 RepID=A0A4P7XKB2_9ALTE|nr:DUF4007 family protein [Hydrocarboniclastica marina]QCF27478.1 DUF4007 family protein [Hydrocarboniclastica marina]